MADYKMAANTFAPASGGTITIPAWDGTVYCCFVNNLGLLAVLNIQLPAGAMDGQAVRIFFNSAITLINMTTLAGTIRGALASALGAQSAVFAWNEATQAWWRG